MFTQNPHDVGIPSYRDGSYQERGTSIGARFTSFAHLIKSITDRGVVDRDKSTGDILGSVYVRPSERDMGSWFHAVPAIKTQYGFYPIFDRTFAPDTRYEPIDAAIPGGAEITNGTPCIILCATKEDGDQELIVMSGGTTAPEDAALSLIAANRNGPYEMGTSVYDLNDKGEADITRQAKLQSAWKVVAMDYSPKSGSTGVPFNGLFGRMAEGVDVPLGDGQLTLKKKKNSGKDKVTVGILPDGAGGILFGKKGKPFDPFTTFGLGNKNKIGFKDKNAGPDVVKVGVGFTGGGISTGPGTSSGPLFGGGPGGFGTSPKQEATT